MSALLAHDDWITSFQEPAFSLLHEASLTSGLLLSCWCPSMDLVAVVSADSQLSVHRLNWQRLWAITVDTPITAMCWRPDGKVLAVGMATGKVRLYDVEKCELVQQTPASPSPSHAISHLQWLDTPPNNNPASMYQQLGMYRHMRLLSKPPQQPPASDAAASLDLSVMAESQHWPSPPSVLSVLVATNDQGHVTLWGLGTFLLASIPPGNLSPRMQHVLGGSHERQAESSGQGGAWGSEAGESHTGPEVAADAHPPGRYTTAVKASSCASADLQYLAQVWSTGAGASTTLHAMLLRNEALATAHSTLLQLAVLFRDLMEALSGATNALQKAGQTWSSAHKELANSLDNLKSCLAEYMPPSQQAAEAVYGIDETDPDVFGDFVCMLAAGHVSQGMLTWLTSSLQEHGLRRLAQQVDHALNSLHSSLLHQVGPQLEVATFLLGELRGLAHPLLGTAGAHQLGLQVHVCADAELQAVKAMLQCDSMVTHVSRLAVQYRAFFTWLLKTVLLLEYDGAAPQQAGGPANAVDGPAAVAAAAASMTVDEEAVLQLLEGQLLQDSIAPDICEGWFDPDITPSSLSFKPALPLDSIQQLMALMYPKSPDPTVPAPAKASGTDLVPAAPQRFPSASKQQQHDAAPISDQHSRGAAPSIKAADLLTPPDTTDRVTEVWPSKPLRKHLQAVTELATGLRDHLCSTISPQCQPAMQVILLPSVEENMGNTASMQPGSACPWFVHNCPATSAAPSGPDTSLPAGSTASANKSDASDAPMVVTLVPPSHLRALTGNTPQQQQPGSGNHTFSVQPEQQGVLYCQFCPSGQSLTGAVHNRDTSTAGRPVNAPSLKAMLVLLPVGCQLQQVAPYKDGYTAGLLHSSTSASMQQVQTGQYAGRESRDDMVDDVSSSNKQQQSVHLVLLPPPALQDLPDYQQQPSILQACLAAGAVTVLGSPHAYDDAGDRVRGRLIARCKSSNAAATGLGASLLDNPNLSVSGPRGVALLFTSRPHRVQLFDLQEDEGGNGEGQGEGDVVGEEGDH